MATFNGEKYLKEQLDSILKQLSTNDELVVSDDGSTDGTLAILAEYAEKDARIKIFEGPKKVLLLILVMPLNRQKAISSF